MTQTVAIFHGYGGYKPNSWLSWLNNQLKDKGINTIYPEFPFLGASTIEQWYEVWKRSTQNITEPVSLIGHSGGTTFALYLAQHSGLTFKKLILVAPLNDIDGADYSKLYDKPGREGQKPFVRNFIHQHFNYELIKPIVKEITFILSDNDPHIPCQETITYFKNIFPEAKFITLHNYGHINEKVGVTELPQVLVELMK